MLDEIKVPIEDLLLDPNNPRFTRDFEEYSDIPDKEIESKQNEVLKKFDKRPSFNIEDVTNIEDLYESMSKIGYVPIDRIVVRTIKDSSKYIVLEGNRRISTIKKILEDYNRQQSPFDKLEKRRQLEPIKSSFNSVTCMLLKTEGLSTDEIAHKVSIIMGLRHHGSLLEWDPLPKAFNIYKVYTGIEPITEAFERKSSKIKEVATRLSIKPAIVTEALKTYIAYLQLCDNFVVKDRYYSLIQAGVTNKNLLEGNYFNITSDTFKLDEESLENMNNACQFASRDNLPRNKKKILPDPKAFSTFGKLFAMRKKSTHEATKSFADDIISQVLDEDDTDMTVDDAVDELTEFINRVKWVDALKILLDKQENELNTDDYSGVGNDRAVKDELRTRLELIRRTMNL